ncbi:hypothetical protein [Nonomuraea sp. GTA35]|uniref:hypothetical protein n=1 Tax=Nonomuraea sp. GTA35 TaxID=1676746 RepID=UPI0035BF7645
MCWLSGEEFHPQPYEQLAASYVADGQHDEARAVLYAKERRQQRDRALLGRVWGLLQDVTVGFGYKPWRAAAWLVVLLAIGGVVYSVWPPPPLKPSESPHFNAVIYALDPSAWISAAGACACLPSLSAWTLCSARSSAGTAS